jgi:hypothetical protein
MLAHGLNSFLTQSSAAERDFIFAISVLSSELAKCLVGDKPTEHLKPRFQAEYVTFDRAQDMATGTRQWSSRIDRATGYTRRQGGFGV